jgi:uncharacterized protein (TIGR03663 family)
VESEELGVESGELGVESEELGVESGEQGTLNSEPETLNSNLWLAGCVVITAIAAFMRFYMLALKPLHHDEGVNGHFLTKLFRDGVYQYDPTNYHGPDLYYLSLAFSKIFGLNTWSVRSSVAIFGVLTVVLAFFLHRYIGRIGSLAAGLFLALSPGMVYISRYFIHEILFVFFSLSFVVAILYFIEKRRAGVFAVSWMSLLLLICFLPTALTMAAYVGEENFYLLWTLRVLILLVEGVLVFFVMRMLINWDGGRPIYLMLASASVIFLLATKETAFITVGTMLIACICVKLWEKLNTSEFYQNNRFVTQFLIQGIVLSALAGLAFRNFDKVKEFYQWFHAVFTGEGVPDQTFLFYSIIFLGTISIVAYLIFFLDSKEFKNKLPAGGEGDTLPDGRVSAFVEPKWRDFREGLGSGADLILIVVASAVVFIYVGVLFFSSFFTYPEGVKGFFEAYAVWTKTGSKDHTQNGWIAYVKWMMQIESPLIFVSVIGTLIAYVKGRHRFAMFAGLWAFGLFLAYTLIPYKTPWLALSFTLPMCIIGGYAINELVRSKEVVQRVLAGILMVFSVFILSYQTYDINFLRYDSDRMPYIYAHTERGFLDLIEEVKRYAEKSEKGKEATIEIVSSDYWPMPWYLNDYRAANFHGRIVPATTAEMVVASAKQLPELAPNYAAHYKYVGKYPLRPGVTLFLLVRKDLADTGALEIYQIPAVD